MEIERYVLELVDNSQNNWFPCYYDYQAAEEANLKEKGEAALTKYDLSEAMRTMKIELMN